MLDDATEDHLLRSLGRGRILASIAEIANLDDGKKMAAAPISNRCAKRLTAPKSL